MTESAQNAAPIWDRLTPGQRRAAAAAFNRGTVAFSFFVTMDLELDNEDVAALYAFLIAARPPIDR